MESVLWGRLNHLDEKSATHRSARSWANSRDTGMWEITPEKSASVFEYMRSCRYAISSECHLMKTGIPMS